MAESPLPGQPQQPRGQVEKSPQDSCVGSIPFDYSQLEDSGCAIDAGSDVPQDDLEEPELLAKAPVHHDEANQSKENSQQTTNGYDDIPREQFKGLLNRKATREIALRLINERFPASEGNPPRFSRVSEKFIDSLDAVLCDTLIKAIARHPSPLLTNTVKQF